MTLDSFQQLSALSQLYFTLRSGVLLTSRQVGEDIVRLYYYPAEDQGFYVEVGFAKADGRSTVLRSEVGGELLAAYSSAGLP